MSDLPERLRRFAFKWEDGGADRDSPAVVTVTEAADTIEQQAKRIERLEAFVGKVRKARRSSDYDLDAFYAQAINQALAALGKP